MERSIFILTLLVVGVSAMFNHQGRPTRPGDGGVSQPGDPGRALSRLSARLRGLEGRVEELEEGLGALIAGLEGAGEDAEDGAGDSDSAGDDTSVIAGDGTGADAGDGTEDGAGDGAGDGTGDGAGDGAGDGTGDDTGAGAGAGAGASGGTGAGAGAGAGDDTRAYMINRMEDLEAQLRDRLTVRKLANRLEELLKQGYRK